MKRTALFVVAMVAATACFGGPIRVALLDFDDQTGMAPDARLGGAVRPGALAEKGPYLLSKHLLGRDAFVLIDRRDFMRQMERLRPKDSGERTPTKPSFLQAAQALNADVVLRGSLLSFSTAEKKVNQAGYKADFTTLTIRVAVEALDAVDGTVVALADGAAQQNHRQTKEVQTVLSEDDILLAFEKAIRSTVPEIEDRLTQRVAKEERRPKVKLSISTSADPALVEIDGILVGSSPIKDLEIYQGDHVLTVGKPGYQDVTKRILFEKSAAIEVPMIRTQLSAEEMKEVMEKMRMHVVVGEPALVIHEVED